MNFLNGVEIHLEENPVAWSNRERLSNIEFIHLRCLTKDSWDAVRKKGEALGKKLLL